MHDSPCILRHKGCGIVRVEERSVPVHNELQKPKVVRQDVEKLARMISEARSVVFFGGAGVSTESGIPDFRSATGLFSAKGPASPEALLHISYFMVCAHGEGSARA